ncbi:MAG TPA: hypothetical protein VMV04_02065 [Thermodesulfobacteriota bacterium]|nr:hypothetical protein [Thermodesulfobacteriota bacterium]
MIDRPKGVAACTRGPPGAKRTGDRYLVRLAAGAASSISVLTQATPPRAQWEVQAIDRILTSSIPIP